MNSIEEQIRRAIEEGKFDALPGKGKPLHLEENPYEDPQWRAAFRILRNSGFTLPWIETRQEIEQAHQAARHDLQRVWVWCQTASNEAGAPGLAQREWEDALSAFRARIAEINKMIRRYNLEVPSTTLQLLILRPEREIEMIIQGKAA